MQTLFFILLFCGTAYYSVQVEANLENIQTQIWLSTLLLLQWPTVIINTFTDLKKQEEDGK